MGDTPRQRILLVDDDQCILEVMGMLLGEADYEVTTAANGLDALMQLNLVRPDVIISDLNMPKMSGYELLSFVRRHFSSIPLIAISGDYEPDLRFPGGVIADAFFAKGHYNQEDLLDTIAALVQNTVAQKASDQRQTDPLQMSQFGSEANDAPLM
jgi:CheY-like chemotaxis protein